MKKKTKKIEYKNHSFRLNEKTYLTFKKFREGSGLSWNLFILKVNRILALTKDREED